MHLHHSKPSNAAPLSYIFMFLFPKLATHCKTAFGKERSTRCLKGMTVHSNINLAIQVSIKAEKGKQGRRICRSST